MSLVASTAPLVYALAGGAGVLGIVLLVTGVRLVIATRADPEALATLEKMSSRKWRPAASATALDPPSVSDTPAPLPPPAAVVETADVEPVADVDATAVEIERPDPDDAGDAAVAGVDVDVTEVVVDDPD